MAAFLTLVYAAAVLAGAGAVHADPAKPTAGTNANGQLKAGAAIVDITPTSFPVIVSGHFNERSADRAYDPLYSRALVLDDGKTRLAIVVVDSCMMPRELLDTVKSLAAKSTGIPPERMLISATHTHSAPSVMGILGSRPDPNYPRFLVPQIVRSIEQAAAKLEPAGISAGVVSDPKHTYCRRWIYRSDRIGLDPFGNRTMRANMHPGYQKPDVIGPAGPVDTNLTLVSFQALDGRPIAVLANYSMHYFGSPLVSADYFGRFAERLATLIGRGEPQRTPVVIMSQGTSGDLQWLDYSQPQSRITMEQYADEVADVAFKLHQSLPPHVSQPGAKTQSGPHDLSLAMAEAKLALQRRAPDAERLAWARKMLGTFKDRQPESLPEVYAQEQIFLDREPQRELKLQAIRIANIGIAALPNEVFGITGLRIREQSPLAITFNIELANGGEGYIPPPEQHKLGGYTTWPARTASLEVEAEPKIVATVLELLKQVGGERRPPKQHLSAYAAAIMKSKPIAYWRLEELSGQTARDLANGHRADYEDLIAHGLPGKEGRCAHFAGGRLRAALPMLGDTYSVEMWVWNGFPTEARPVTGYLFARAAKNGSASDQLAIGGTTRGRGRLLFTSGSAQVEGRTPLTFKKPTSPGRWHHVVLVRDPMAVDAYLDGQKDLLGQTPPGAGGPQFDFGGSVDRAAPFEGKLDEISMYDRALSDDEVTAHYRAATKPNER